VVGTNVEYAPYVELGTHRQKAQPYLRPAAEGHTAEYKQIIKTEMSNA
jgi:HK97 gp10 family phage protein